MRPLIYIFPIFIFSLFACKEKLAGDLSYKATHFSAKELSLLFDSSEAYYISLDSIGNFAEYKTSRAGMYQSWKQKGHQFILRPTVVTSSSADNKFKSLGKSIRIQLSPLGISLGGGWNKKNDEILRIIPTDSADSFLTGNLLQLNISTDSLAPLVRRFFLSKRNLWVERYKVYSPKTSSFDRPFIWQTDYQPEIFLEMTDNSFNQVETILRFTAIGYLSAMRTYSGELFGKPIDSLNGRETIELRKRLPLNIRIVNMR